MAAVSMSKQEFVRLEVLLGAQSGRLRVADACALIRLRRRQVFLLLRGVKRLHLHIAPSIASEFNCVVSKLTAAVLSVLAKDRALSEAADVDIRGPRGGPGQDLGRNPCGRASAEVFRTHLDCQTARCRSSAVEAPRQTQQPSAAGRGSCVGRVARARSVSRLWPDPGGGEAGDAARLFDLA
jgi:hypothetical protein